MYWNKIYLLLISTSSTIVMYEKILWKPKRNFRKKIRHLKCWGGTKGIRKKTFFFRFRRIFLNVATEGHVLINSEYTLSECIHLFFKFLNDFELIWTAKSHFLIFCSKVPAAILQVLRPICIQIFSSQFVP